MGRLPLKSPASSDQSRVVLDPLALIACVGALLACCPAASMLGVITGALSYARIRRSGGKLRGAGLALGAAITSLVIGILSLGIGERFQTSGQSAMNSDVRRAVDQFLNGSVDPSSWWRGVDPVELLAFQRTVRDRLGALRTGSVTQTDVQLGLASSAQFRILLESAAVETVASARVDVVTDLNSLLPSIRLRSLSIQIPSGSDGPAGATELVFPARETPMAPDSLPSP